MSEPVDRALYDRIKNMIMRKRGKWSAYASGELVQTYKREGGRYRSRAKRSRLARWFDEEWINVCTGKPCGRRSRSGKYPYCRPKKRITKDTPRIASSLSKSQIRSMCKKKQRNPSKRMRSLSRRRAARRSRSRTRVRLTRSKNPSKKFKAEIEGKCSVHFGGRGYSDFTKHKDPKRMQRYLIRHRKRENWTKSGLCTAGFWSKHLLWNKPGMAPSKRDMEKRFGLKFI